MKLSSSSKKFVLVAAAALAATWMAWGACAEVPRIPFAADAWELDIQLSDLHAIQVTVPGEQAPRTFWFIKYTVANHSDKDQIFVPDFTLCTDTGQIIPASKGVSPSVFDAIRKVYNDPYLKTASAMTGKLLQGEDNAKNGVAIFQDFDSAAGSVNVFVGGISGDTMEVSLPSPVKVTEMRNGKKVETELTKTVLAKTMDLKFKFPKNPAEGARRDKLVLQSKTWVMR